MSYKSYIKNKYCLNEILDPIDFKGFQYKATNKHIKYLKQGEQKLSLPSFEIEDMYLFVKDMNPIDPERFRESDPEEADWIESLNDRGNPLYDTFSISLNTFGQKILDKNNPKGALEQMISKIGPGSEVLLFMYGTSPNNKEIMYQYMSIDGDDPKLFVKITNS